MTEKEIATFYQTLPKRDKGLFTAYVSVKLGGSPHSWQARFIKMFRGQVVRPLFPVVVDALSSIIEGDLWKRGSMAF